MTENEEVEDPMLNGFYATHLSFVCIEILYSLFIA
jgi:hypothetical protein